MNNGKRCSMVTELQPVRKKSSGARRTAAVMPFESTYASDVKPRQPGPVRKGQATQSLVKLGPDDVNAM